MLLPVDVTNTDCCPLFNPSPLCTSPGVVTAGAEGVYGVRGVGGGDGDEEREPAVRGTPLRTEDVHRRGHQSQLRRGCRLQGKGQIWWWLLMGHAANYWGEVISDRDW